jgi:integrase/recombinase XerD
VLLVREGKGGRDRFVPVGERAVEWTERWLTFRPRYVVPPDEGWLFLTKRGRPLAPKRLSELAHRYLEASGVGKTGSCHLFRHTMATLMLEAGADVRHIQEILGHAVLSTTALYTHVSITKLQEVHRRTHPARAHRTERDHEKLLSSLAAETPGGRRTVRPASPGARSRNFVTSPPKGRSVAALPRASAHKTLLYASERQ